MSSNGFTMVMLLSHCGEYPCECKKYIFAANSPESGEYKANGLTNAIRHQSQWSQNDRQTFVGVRKHSRSFRANSSKSIRLSRRITEKRGLTKVTNACEFLTNPCEFLTKLTIT